MKSKRAYRMNVRGMVYAIVVSDSEAGTVYGDVKPFASARQIQISPTIATGEIYGDGAKEVSISKTTGYDVQVDINKVAVEVNAEIYGHTINSDGILVIGERDQPKELALGFEVEQDGNEREVVWLLKGSPQPFGNTVQQTQNDISFSTDSIKISFVKRQSDGNFYVMGDTAYEGFTGEAADKFLLSVPTDLKGAAQG